MSALEKGRGEGAASKQAMILWMIQEESVWETWQKRGVIRADGRRIDRDVRQAYRWMTRQMEQRIGPRPAGVNYPVWAWSQCEDARRPRPDLRSSDLLPPGCRGVRVEFETDESNVLLSDFELWHYVLNYWYLGRSWADCRRFERRVRASGFDAYARDDRQTSPLASTVEESWERIFDLNWSQRSMASPRHEKSIQATLWEISLEAVSRVRHFVSR